MQDQNIKYLIYSFVISILIIYIFKNFYSKIKWNFWIVYYIVCY